jgi:mannose-6-phosphate isomerase-like protein (cupin superfamily)
VAEAPSAGALVPVQIVPKPWGHEVIWARTDQYVGKILHINAGQALSVQYHEQKDETVYLLRGRLKYRVGEARHLSATETPALREFEMQEGQSFRNTPGTIHQMEAITDCDMLEASTPFLDDVVRLADRYGRQGTSAP